MFFRKQILLSECAILIQSAFRRVFSNRLVEAAKVKVVMLRLKEKLAVICIQSFSWKYICLRNAVIGIQSVFRQFIDACQVESKVDSMKNRVEMQGQIEELAIVVIQTFFRKKSLVIKAVIAIQSMLRQVCSVRQVVLEEQSSRCCALKRNLRVYRSRDFSENRSLSSNLSLDSDCLSTNDRESVAISRIQYFLGNQIFSYKACVKIQAFLRRFSAIHLVDAKPCEIRVRQSVVNIQSLIRSFIAQTRFRDDLIDGTLSLSLTTRRLFCVTFALMTFNSPSFTDYLLNNGGLEKLLDSIEELSRGHPSELVLRPVFQYDS
uniref:Uncharacterized protein n=1 Tax=Ditylenchus dipsaci TaxID=166011 RepID=A0A915EK10_9BILA